MSVMEEIAVFVLTSTRLNSSWY